MDLLQDSTAIAWGIGIPFCLVSCSYLFRLLGMNEKTKLGSTEADVMSFEVTAGLCLIHLAYYGLVCLVFLFFIVSNPIQSG